MTLILGMGVLTALAMVIIWAPAYPPPEQDRHPHMRAMDELADPIRLHECGRFHRAGESCPRALSGRGPTGTGVLDGERLGRTADGSSPVQGLGRSQAGGEHPAAGSRGVNLPPTPRCDSCRTPLDALGNCCGVCDPADAAGWE